MIFETKERDTFAYWTCHPAHFAFSRFIAGAQPTQCMNWRAGIKYTLGSPFPADYPKPVPLAVVSLDSKSGNPRHARIHSLQEASSSFCSAQTSRQGPPANPFPKVSNFCADFATLGHESHVKHLQHLRISECNVHWMGELIELGDWCWLGSRIQNS